MEGYLYKWTNYYSGWQPRWFILDGGVLSYYASSTEVQQGSKGSIKIASCDIKAHHKDNQRIDLVIKGGIHMYLRANTQTERQKWLVAFGSTKQQELSMETSTIKPGEYVKSRMVNLHLSCQLLVTHIASLKTALNEPKDINDKKLDDLSIALSSKCDEFLNALAECMDLSYGEDNWPEYIQPLSLKQLATPSPILSGSRKLGGIVRTPSNGFSAEELYSSSPIPSPLSPSTVNKPHLPTAECSLPIPSPLSPSTANKPHLPSAECSFPVHLQKSQGPAVKSSKEKSPRPNKEVSSRSSSEVFLTPTSSPLPSPTSSCSLEDQLKYETFFSSLTHKFSDIHLINGEGIPTDAFLQCCSDVIPFFDTLSPTAFGPVKADINGNIEKLRHKYSQDPTAYYTLQAIVKHEIDTGTHNAKNSATDALLWLKRAVEFVQTFIDEVAKGEQNLGAAAGTAYSKSLKQYHNWLVRGIFNIAVKAVPYYSDFLKMLGSDGSVEYNEAVVKDMKLFSDALGGHISILRQLYLMYQLDTPPKEL